MPLEPAAAARRAPARHLLGGARERLRIQSLGFSRRPSGPHFTRQDVVAFRVDAERLAMDLLTVAFCVFHYRGGAPFQVERSPLLHAPLRFPLPRRGRLARAVAARLPNQTRRRARARIECLVPLHQGVSLCWLGEQVGRLEQARDLVERLMAERDAH